MSEKDWLLPGLERRFQPRILIEIEANYLAHSGAAWRPASIRDLSGGGVAAFVADRLDLGTALSGFRFLLPDETGTTSWPLVLSAQVVHCSAAADAVHPFLARLQFLPPAPREIETLRRYVHRALYGPAAAEIPLEIPAYETAARIAVENRLARRLEEERRRLRGKDEDSAGWRRQRELLEQRNTGLQEALHAAVATEERLRAEIHRLNQAREAPAATSLAVPDHPDFTAARERMREERERLVREREAARTESAALRRRLDEATRKAESSAEGERQQAKERAELGKARAELEEAQASLEEERTRIERWQAEFRRDQARFEDEKASDRNRQSGIERSNHQHVAELESRIETLTAERNTLRAEKRKRRQETLAAERPLLPPRPVEQPRRPRTELFSLLAGLILGASAIFVWYRFFQEPPKGTTTSATAPIEVADLTTAPPPEQPSPEGPVEPADSEPLSTTSRLVPAAPPLAEPDEPTNEPMEPEAGSSEPRAATLAATSVEPSLPPPSVEPPEEEASAEAANGAPTGPPNPAREEKVGVDEPPPPQNQPVPDEPNEPAEPATLSAEDTAIAATLDSWATAWTEQRADDHLALYDETFSPAERGGLEAWENERRRLVTHPSAPKVSARVTRTRKMTQSRALVFTRVTCEAGSQRVEAAKTFELLLSDGLWRIVREYGGSGCPLEALARADE